MKSSFFGVKPALSHGVTAELRAGLATPRPGRHCALLGAVLGLGDAAAAAALRASAVSAAGEAPRRDRWTVDCRVVTDRVVDWM